jgi:hypothetical protein
MVVMIRVLSCNVTLQYRKIRLENAENIGYCIRTVLLLFNMLPRNCDTSIVLLMVSHKNYMGFLSLKINLGLIRVAFFCHTDTDCVVMTKNCTLLLLSI